ncbi:uroporphyrinogen-III synthase [Simiduia aestuariiviva]|uniref:Uroporphyrinogen-III synthase n=1 Tax=Simiduia aestuariiviva TaxID=1510459 RepID=A0A839USK5_9GAMM|nr:uroporphyrinogen-III synthase [Simiduia aestuariiviva]MBB3169681.1 uroporphyrinogen-III synthase [Simiduia aestuariiviva]
MKRRLWLTRPAHQAAATTQAFSAPDVDVVSVPVMAIAPLREPAQQQAVRDRILDFDRYDFAIFISQNAVHYGTEWLDEYWPQLPLHCQFLAVGQATATALSAAGLPVVSELPLTSAMNSEALLALPALSELKDKQILIFRGRGGRTHLGDTLRARGARVDYCELYERELPVDAPARVGDALALGPAWLSVHSGESLQHLYQLLQDQADSYSWRTWPLLVPGARVAAMAEAMGFSHILVADNATDGAMAARLRQALTAAQDGVPSARAVNNEK